MQALVQVQCLAQAQVQLQWKTVFPSVWLSQTKNLPGEACIYRNNLFCRVVGVKVQIICVVLHNLYHVFG